MRKEVWRDVILSSVAFLALMWVAFSGPRNISRWSRIVLQSPRWKKKGCVFNL